LSLLGDSKPSSGPLAQIALGARLARSAFVARKYSHELSNRIREFAPDLVHSNSLKMHLLGTWGQGPRPPIIWHLHDYLSSRPFMSKALRFQRRRCAAVLANSDGVRDDARSALHGGPEVSTLYNAIDVSEFSPYGPVADLDRMCNLQLPAAGAVRVGLIATMAWWKGHRDFIRAMALLCEEKLGPEELGDEKLDDVKNIRGYIIGGPLYDSEGSQESIEQLRALSTQLGLQSRMGFTGFVDKPSSAIRALDIVVHASTRPEPFGRVIVEAMACGKPVITTAVGGAAELVTIGQDALDFRMSDPAHLAERIRELARDPALRERLGCAGRITAVKKFNRERLGRQLVAFYRQVLGRVN
jgi:glycosyltransferase involved in cell wall biosynthesis